MIICTTLAALGVSVIIPFTPLTRLAPRMLLQGIPNKQRMLGVLRDPHASPSALATPSLQHIIGQPLKQKMALRFLPANVVAHVAPFAAILSPPLSSRMEKAMAVGCWDICAGFSRG